MVRDFDFIYSLVHVNIFLPHFFLFLGKLLPPAVGANCIFSMNTGRHSEENASHFRNFPTLDI